MGTDNEEAHGNARILGLALRFLIPSQASLHGIVQTHRSLAPRAALLLRALREIKNGQELESRKSMGHARLAGMAEFLKRHLQVCLRGDLQKGRSIRAANNPVIFLLPHPC